MLLRVKPTGCAEPLAVSPGTSLPPRARPSTASRSSASLRPYGVTGCARSGVLFPGDGTKNRLFPLRTKNRARSMSAH